MTASIAYDMRSALIDHNFFLILGQQILLILPFCCLPLLDWSFAYQCTFGCLTFRLDVIWCLSLNILACGLAQIRVRSCDEFILWTRWMLFYPFILRLLHPTHKLNSVLIVSLLATRIGPTISCHISFAHPIYAGHPVVHSLIESSIVANDAEKSWVHIISLQGSQGLLISHWCLTDAHTPTLHQWISQHLGV